MHDIAYIVLQCCGLQLLGNIPVFHFRFPSIFVYLAVLITRFCNFPEYVGTERLSVEVKLRYDVHTLGHINILQLPNRLIQQIYRWLEILQFPLQLLQYNPAAELPRGVTRGYLTYGTWKAFLQDSGWKFRVSYPRHTRRYACYQLSARWDVSGTSR